MNKTIFNTIKIILITFYIFLFISVSNTGAEVLYEDDFEAGWNTWFSDDEAWEIGMPHEKDSNCHSGVNCAVIHPGRQSVDHISAKLISSNIDLPDIASDEELWLKFWHWYVLEHSLDHSKQALLQFSIDGGEWQTAYGPFYGDNQEWEKVYVDLTALAGSTIQIGFLVSSDLAGTDDRWYVDDIVIEVLKCDYIPAVQKVIVP